MLNQMLLELADLRNQLETSLSGNFRIRDHLGKIKFKFKIGLNSNTPPLYQKIQNKSKLFWKLFRVEDHRRILVRRIVQEDSVFLRVILLFNDLYVVSFSPIVDQFVVAVEVFLEQTVSSASRLGDFLGIQGIIR